MSSNDEGFANDKNSVSRLYYAWNIMYVFVARLEDGEQVAECVSNFSAPKIGKIMCLRHRGNYQDFEVIGISSKLVSGYEIVNLKVELVK